MSDNIFKECNSSFELLRLVLMTIIVVHHSILHGLGFSGYGLDKSVILNSHLIPIAVIIDSLCICAVNCFILI